MLKIYNTLSKKKEDFKPLEDKKVGLYSCGPTVYGYAHLGNFRAYVFVDILKRYLVYRKYEVNHIMNLTDIDDKTINRSQKEKISLTDLTKKYEDAFREDLKFLNIKEANKLPRATEHIGEMVKLIQKLLKKKIAYQAEDGSVYFSISKFENYGKIADLDNQELKENAGGRLQSDEYEKENARDFVLWKAYSKEDGDVFWEPNSLGKGRPGWHIECSAMSMKFLGESFDIHTGGVDLIFPHHTNEIAQSEAATGKQFVKYWLHNEHLLVNGKKMSKSAGNFYTLRDLQKKGYSGRALRYLLARMHYRQKLDFKEDLIKEAESVLEKFDNIAEMLGGKIGDSCLRRNDRVECHPERPAKDLVNKKINILIDQARKHFESAMDGDLDAHHALIGIFDFMKKVNSLSEKLSKKNAKDILDFLKEIDEVLGFIFSWEVAEKIIVDSEIQKMIEERNKAKENKDFAKADKIRDDLSRKGVEIMDTPQGIKIKIKK